MGGLCEAFLGCLMTLSMVFLRPCWMFSPSGKMFLTRQLNIKPETCDCDGNTDKPGIKHLNLNPQKLPLKRNHSGHAGFGDLLFSYLTIQADEKQQVDAAGIRNPLSPGKPSRRNSNSMSVSFHLLHLFWEDHLYRQGYLLDLSGQPASRTAVLIGYFVVCTVLKKLD